MILAIDPGLAFCGWSVVRPRVATVVALGVIASKPGAIASRPDGSLAETADRAARARAQAKELAAIAARYEVTTIAAEGMSLGGPPKARIAMAICLGLSWGVIVALAEQLGVDLLELPPKQWQHAVMPEVGDGAIDYEALFRRMSRFVHGQCSEQLRTIPRGQRNHALDAVGVGVYAALRASSATQIGAIA